MPQRLHIANDFPHDVDHAGFYDALVAAGLPVASVASVDPVGGGRVVEIEVAKDAAGDWLPAEVLAMRNLAATHMPRTPDQKRSERLARLADALGLPVP